MAARHHIAPCPTCDKAVVQRFAYPFYVIRCENELCPEERWSYGTTQQSAADRWNWCDPMQADGQQKSFRDETRPDVAPKFHAKERKTG